MNINEFFSRNPSIIEKINRGQDRRSYWEVFFPSLESVSWSSSITKYLKKSGPAVLYPVRTKIKYTELTLQEYDEQLAMNQKFERIYRQEKREKEFREAAAQYDC